MVNLVGCHEGASEGAEQGHAAVLGRLELAPPEEGHLVLHGGAHGLVHFRGHEALASGRARLFLKHFK